MSRVCPQSSCSRTSGVRVIRFGSYYRSSDRHWIPRFRCKGCRHTFSQATFDPCFGHKKRHLHDEIAQWFASGASIRRLALILKIDKTTVCRKLEFLGCRDQKAEETDRSTLPLLKKIQFDELETFEHTKYKPLSVFVAVDAETRRILGYEVASMPAKGLLAKKARAKYGPRVDHRAQALRALLQKLQPIVSPTAVILSDQNPHYPGPVKRWFPNAMHVTVEGRRGCVTGQGELKEGRFDPLFSLNHTLAMFRANINRLFRRTWCTTKVAARLADHLAIYVRYHNTALIRS